MLWVFGDSYSVDSTFMKNNPDYSQFIWEPDNCWVEKLAEKLYGDKHQRKIFAEYGVSNDWIFHSVTEQFDNIKPNDYVIVQLSSSSRKWFFEDRPKCSNILSTAFRVGEDISKEEDKAIKMYGKYLHNLNLDDIIYKSYVLSLEYIALFFRQNDVKMIVLPGFHDVNGVKGNLGDICFNEFADEKSRTMFYDGGTVDPRMNHITPDNHEILAEKIYRFFEHGETVDLTSGFKLKVLNHKMFSYIDVKDRK